MEQVFSPSQGRIDKLIELKELKEQGIYLGIPLWESFPILGEVVPTIDKGQVVLNCAASGVGKSMITRHKDIITPWLFVKRHPELEIDLKFVIFLLEDDEDRFKDYIISELLYLKFDIRINPKRLRSSFKEPLSQAILDKIKEIQPAIDDLLNRCIIEDSTYNSYGIYKKCRLLSEKWGEHYYTDMLGKKIIIPREEYNKLPLLGDLFKETSVKELTDSGKNPTDYKEYYKYSHYTLNNPKQHVIVIIDNINCLHADKFEDGLKGAMDNLMYNYVRKNISKHWNWSVVAVQQNVGGAEEQSFTYKGENIIEKLIPNLSMLGDSKLTQRACHLIYGLFDPQRYGVTEFMGYDITRLKKASRFLYILKNNDGEGNLVIPLLFIGESSYFSELPKPTEMTEAIYKKIESKNK
jgi:hypothetical protein